MKKISLLLLTLITSAFVIAQLENTRWKSTVTIEEPVNVIFDLKKIRLHCTGLQTVR
jgi:hypothetical protein